MKVLVGAIISATAGAGYLAYRYFRRRSLASVDLQDTVVLITGGSRGFGLAMAREFGSRGATVAICARDSAELERARADLTSRGVRTHTFICEITDPGQVAATVSNVAGLLGPIDILVNNAGIITVGPFEEMSVEDFEQAMKVMFWGPLYMTRAVLPGMRARKQGRIVNITSIGGKVTVPHLLPYCCAKFAVLALSEGLRAELAPLGIQVTTIAPGLLRTGSHLNALFKGKQAGEYAWFTLGAATPLVSIGVERAARSVIDAMLQGRAEKILSAPAGILARVYGLSPGLVGGLLGVAHRLLPLGNGGMSQSRAGHEIERGFDSFVWKMITGSGRRAAEDLNEIKI